ncbi:hypothetical protein F2Q70_00021065 [Brassica cretica]|uniref:Uncharacterized protein n=2 Tax=Brassica cretica TaxID=69181 RepID=A0A3N6RN86_BRACR|nr:hypothetical protein F2Q70_00021065 [Brassica cretica]KAF2554552.1 hypothetical protein F2Q68_00014547 [Brassica cretica]KAF3607213.1 hypothetical protein DY000_02047054 [Brassica cretica]
MDVSPLEDDRDDASIDTGVSWPRDTLVMAYVMVSGSDSGVGLETPQPVTSFGNRIWRLRCSTEDEARFLGLFPLTLSLLFEFVVIDEPIDM